MAQIFADIFVTANITVKMCSFLCTAYIFSNICTKNKGKICGYFCNCKYYPKILPYFPHHINFCIFICKNLQKKYMVIFVLCKNYRKYSWKFFAERKNFRKKLREKIRKKVRHPICKLVNFRFQIVCLTRVFTSLLQKNF